MRVEPSVGPNRDPQTCRRALREIGEIAAVAVLPDSQMTDREALQSISAIAEWAREDAPGAGVDCGNVITRIHAMTRKIDLDGLDDTEALALFSDVLGALEASNSNVFLQ